jgi:hypothetical protein
MSEITQNKIVTVNEYLYCPLVSFKYRNGNDEIVTIETHIKDISRNSYYIHGYMDGKSYLRNRIVGPIELLEFCGYVAEMAKELRIMAIHGKLWIAFLLSVRLKCFVENGDGIMWNIS